MKYWLMKSEPGMYSIDNLQKDKRTLWENIRNYQARNFMMKDIQVGDLVLFYHSNAEPSGVAGVGKITQTAVSDPSQFDKKSDYHDGKATNEKPIWFCVEVGFVEKFKHLVALAELKANSHLKDMLVIQKGQRLSIQPVEEKHFHQVLKMAKSK